MAMSAAGAKLPNPWEAVGRETEVGRALFALYNGYGVARNRGNNYSDHNRMKIMERISTQGLPDLYRIPPDLPKPKRPAVKVPRFRKKYVTIDEIPQVLLMRGRRKGSQILTRLKEELLQKEQPPQPKRPMLDEKEKARLQEIFEWSGRDIDDEDEAKSDVLMAPRKPPPPRGSVKEQELLIEAIAKEIEERKEFLDRMFELGRGPKYEPMIRLEIQERVRQMGLLHKNISRMDKERLEGQADHSSRSLSQPIRHDPLQLRDEKPCSRASSSTTIRNFKEQLNAVRNEAKALKRDHASSKTDQEEGDDFADLSDGEISCSEKSSARQSPISSVKSVKSGSETGNIPAGQLHAAPSTSRTLGNEFLKSLMSQCDDASSPHSSNGSSVQSGTIRSSLKSLKPASSLRSGANSSHNYSIVSM